MARFMGSAGSIPESRATASDMEVNFRLASPFVSFHSIIAVGSPPGMAILTGSAGSSNVDPSEGASAVV